MAENRTIQLGVEVDASGAKAGLDQVKQAVTNTATAVAAAAKPATTAVDGIGAGAVTSSKKLEAATRSMINAIQRTTAVMEAGERGSTKYFEALAAQRGINVEVLRPYLTQLDAIRAKQDASTVSLDRMGVSAGQTAAALRQLPAQFTDIFTSLASGQAPLTVLLQQGGQIKDSFGGVGNALKSTAAYLVGLVNPLTITAAALAGVAVAYAKGAAEAGAYQRALIGTGNQIGLTVPQLQAMAKSMDAIGTTQMTAAAGLTEFVKAGRVGAESIERFTLAAIRMESAGGESVAKIAEQFAKLGAEPLQASLKLTESMGYLTAAVAQQIKELETAGRTADAARLAQETYAQSLEDRAPRMEASLGLVERAWLKVKAATKEALDAALDIGRTADPLVTLNNQIALVERRIQQQRALGPTTETKRSIEGLEAQLAALKAQLPALQANNIAAVQSAEAHARDAAQMRAWVEASAVMDRYLTNEEKKRRELIEVQNKLLKAGYEQWEIEQALDKVRAKYADKTTKLKDEKDAWEGLRTTLEKTAAGVDGLTESEKLQIELQKAQYQGTTLVDAANRLYLQGLAAAIDIEKQDAATKALQAKAAEEVAETIRKVDMERARELLTLDQQITRQREHNVAMVSGKTATLDLEIAELQRQQSVAAGIPGEEKYIDFLQQQIDKKRELQGLTAQGDQIAQQKHAAEEAARSWTQTVDRVAHGFADFLVDVAENGASAFKNLWNNFKRWALEALAEIAAKQVVVSLVGTTSMAATGSTAASGIGSAIGSAGGAGSLISGLGAAFGLGESASLGIGTALSNVGTILPTLMETGSFSAAFAGMGASFAVLAPWAAIAAIAIPLIIDAFDKGPAMRTGDFVSSTASTIGTGNPLFQSRSAFGSFGVVNDRWFSDSDMGSTFKSFLSGIQSLDNAIANIVGPAMTQAVSAALSSVTTGFEAGVEHETVTFGSIVGQRYAVVLNTIHAGLGDLLQGFSGTGEEMATFVLGLVKVQQGLDALDLKGLDLSSLQAFQLAGEALPDTFTRVVGAYGTFVDAFTTDAEKLKSAQTLVTDTFAQLGLDIPKDITAYRELVQQQNLATESGRSTWQTLLDVSGAFLLVQQAAGGAIDGVSGMVAAANDLHLAIAKYRGSSTVDIAQLEADAALAAVRRIPGLEGAGILDLIGLTPERIGELKLTSDDVGVIVTAINAHTDLNAALRDQATAAQEAADALWSSFTDTTARFRPAATREAAVSSLVAATADMTRQTGLTSLDQVLGLSRDAWLGFTQTQRDSIINFVTWKGAVADFDAKLEETATTLRDTIGAALIDVTAMLDPMGEALGNMGTQWEQLLRKGDQVGTLAAYYDGSLAGTQNLLQATQQYYAATVQVLGVIDQLKTSITELYQQNIRTFTMAGMTDEQKYRFLQTETAAMVEEIKTATDPTRINTLSQSIASNQLTAWNLLSPDQQTALRDQFITGANDAAALARERLAASEKEAKDKWDAMVTDVRTALGEAADAMNKAGETQQGAAGAMQRAVADFAGATITVDVGTPRTPTVGTY